MSHDHGRRCECVAEHRPPVLELEEHHVLPLYLGGAKSGETRWLCPTTHANVHEIIRDSMRIGTLLPRQEGQPRYAYALAREAYLRWAVLILRSAERPALPEG